MNEWKCNKRPSNGTAAQATAISEFTPGMVLVKRGVELPSFVSRSELEGMTWDLLSGVDVRNIEMAARNERWHFFYIVPAIVARAISVRRHEAISKAVRRAINAVETEGVNAVEIVSIRASRKFGVSFVEIEAQPRHVRHEPFAFDLKPHRWATWKPEASVAEVQDAESIFSLAA